MIRTVSTTWSSLFSHKWARHPYVFLVALIPYYAFFSLADRLSSLLDNLMAQVFRFVRCLGQFSAHNITRTMVMVPLLYTADW